MGLEIGAINTALEKLEASMMQRVEKRDEEIKQFGETTSETAKKMSNLENEMKSLVEMLSEVKEELKQVEAQAELALPETAGSLGQRFAGSEELKDYLGVQGMTNKSRAFEVGHSLGDPDFALEAKTTVTGASLANRPSYLYQTPRVAEYLKDPDRRIFVRSLIPTIGTTAGAVEFVRENTFTNNADVVPEYVTTDSTQKPESALTFDILSVPVRTIAHWIPATRQIISDSRQLRGYIDQRLIQGLRLKEDQQILFGTGTGNEVQGIMTDSGRQTYTQVTETKIDAVRQALTLAAIAEYSPSGIVMNHNDWRDVELEKGTDDHYIWVNVTIDNVTRLWGLPVVTTNAMTSGRALVGDFARGTAIHDREDANVRVSDSHGELFTRNIWVILAEERIAQTVYLPSAFVDITFV